MLPSRFANRVLVAMTAALTAACAASADTAAPAAADADKLVCTREPATGSLRPTVSCRTLAQIERERDHAQKTMNFVRQDAGEATPDRIGR